MKQTAPSHRRDGRKPLSPCSRLAVRVGKGERALLQFEYRDISLGAGLESTDLSAKIENSCRMHRGPLHHLTEIQTEHQEF